MQRKFCDDIRLELLESPVEHLLVRIGWFSGHVSMVMDAETGHPGFPVDAAPLVLEAVGPWVIGKFAIRTNRRDDDANSFSTLAPSPAMSSPGIPNARTCADLRPLPERSQLRRVLAATSVSASTSRLAVACTKLSHKHGGTLGAWSLSRACRLTNIHLHQVATPSNFLPNPSLCDHMGRQVAEMTALDVVETPRCRKS